jgi:hypothetical protein
MGDNLSMNTNRHFERATINIQFTLVINARRNLLRRYCFLLLSKWLGEFFNELICQWNEQIRE